MGTSWLRAGLRLALRLRSIASEVASLRREVADVRLELARVATALEHLAGLPTAGVADSAPLSEPEPFRQFTAEDYAKIEAVETYYRGSGRRLPDPAETDYRALYDQLLEAGSL